MTAWDNEIVPPRLVALGQGIRVAFSLPVTAIGHKGDTAHRAGYHRSRRWILIDGDGWDDYSIQSILDQSGNENWVSACDASLSPAQMVAATSRIITAMRAGDPRTRAVREVYGTTDGRTVTGWDADAGRWVSSDPSHLWHLHISLYRSRADDDHSGLAAVITGEGDDMELHQRLTTRQNGNKSIEEITLDQYDQIFNGMPEVRAAVRQLLTDVKELKARPAATVTMTAEDRTDIAAQVLAGMPTLEQIAVAVAIEDHRRSAG